MLSQDIEVLHAGYSYHTKPFYTAAKDGLKQYLFRIQSEGCSRVLIEGKLEEIEQGEVVLFKPSDPYELSIEASSGDYFIFCRGTWLDQWWEQQQPPQRLKLTQINQLLSLFRNIVSERRKDDQLGLQIADYLMKALCLQIERFIKIYGGAAYDTRSFLGLRMKAYVEEHALQSFMVADVAQHAGLSVSRTVHLYKEMYGMSIMQHAMNIRLESAVERMLFTPMTLEQVAEMSGFGSYSYFHRCFKEKYGVSPREYRNPKTAEENRLI